MIKKSFYLLVLFQIILTNCKSERLVQTECKCLKGSIDILKYKETFSDLDYKRKFVIDLPVFKENTMTMYVDSNLCIYTDKSLYNSSSLFELFYKFIKNPKRLKEYSSNPEYATVLVYSNSYGKSGLIKNQLDSIHEEYRRVLDTLRNEVAYLKYSKGLGDLTAMEFDEIESTYPYHIFFYPHKRSGENFSNMVENINSLQDNVIRVYVNVKNELLLKKNRIKLESLKDSLKSSLRMSEISKVIISHDRGTSPTFLQTIYENATSSIDELRAEYLNLLLEEYVKLSEMDSLYIRASKKYPVGIIIKEVESFKDP